MADDRPVNLADLERVKDELCRHIEAHGAKLEGISKHLHNESKINEVQKEQINTLDKRVTGLTTKLWGLFVGLLLVTAKALFDFIPKGG